MSLFSSLDAAAQTVQEAIYGDGFQYQPMARVGANRNAAPVADTTRAAATITAIFVTKQGKQFETRQYDPKADKRPGLSVDTEEIEIDGRWGLTVARDDQLSLIAATRYGAAGQAWRVESTYVDDLNRTHCICNRIN